MNIKVFPVVVAVFLALSGTHLLVPHTHSINHVYDASQPHSVDDMGGLEDAHQGMHLTDKAPPYMSTEQSGGCKLIMAVGAATAGDYNLLLKVRDPARPGLQVLCSIPQGYAYEYHHPWTGVTMHFDVNYTFIGTTTKGDVPPNITKPGMMMSEAGLAFGDADTVSYLVNPSRHAWDDFDWMRYAAQSAEDIDEATFLLTHKVVDELHAPSIAENLFVVGANKGIVIEADAFNYRIRDIEDVAIQSNYPKDLWDTHIQYPLLVAEQFNATLTQWVEQGQRIHLGGHIGVRITDIGVHNITVRLTPFGINRRIPLGEGLPLGNFWVELLGIQDGRARIFLCFSYFAWESKMHDIIDQVDAITVNDMMNWSRIHSPTLDGLRGMCEGNYEVATIYKIPGAYPQFLSTLWFAADQCASIFIPVHMCAREIYGPYETGEAHRVALQLLTRYGHGGLSRIFADSERTFLFEAFEAEQRAHQLLDDGKIGDAIELLTHADVAIQTKAFLLEQLWLNMSYLSKGISRYLSSEILDIWENHHIDVNAMEDALSCVSLLLREGELHDTDEHHLMHIKNLLLSLALMQTMT